MLRRTFLKRTGTAGLITLIDPSVILSQFRAQNIDPLFAGFVQPPHAAYPQTFWFWMNGHVSKEGITLDLEAMKRVGIGGVFNFDAGTGIPKGPVNYLSDEWLALKKFSIKEAARLDLDYTLHNCPGWSSSGGPWITPGLAMQQLTWSETYVAGGKKIDQALPKPFHRLDFYKDIAVIAYPALEGEALMQSVTVSTDHGAVGKKNISGHHIEEITIRPFANAGSCWLQYEFKQKFTARSVTFLIASEEKIDATREPVFFGQRTSVLLEASNDGILFSTVVSINTGIESELMLGYKFITYDIPATTAKYFRITAGSARRFSQVRFSSITRLTNFMEKAGNRFQFYGQATSPQYLSAFEEVPSSSIIKKEAIIDISGYVDGNGKLNWEAPGGDWTILRFGYTPVGAVNKAAPEGGIGLECDKFSKEAIRFHFDKMIEPLLPVLKEVTLNGNVGLEIDSYEGGPQSWSPNFSIEFSDRRKYDLLNYLPAITGRGVESIEHTERFLYDYRRTQADLIADNYYGEFTHLCHQHGFTSFVEPYDKGPFEEMQIGAKADVVMGEYWNGLFSVLQGNLPIRRTPKLAASIAHINGKKVTALEAFTSEPHSAAWQMHPFSLKAIGDVLFTKGVNKLIIHRFAHQPHPTASPGMTMGPWGIHFDRTNTWWEEGASWISYNARCQYLLQQGLFVADLAYFTGEDANMYTRVNRNELTPPPPKGYDYDLMNRDVLLNTVKVKNNEMVLPNGMTYKVLVLQNYKALSLEVLQKINELVKQGMIVVGAKPERSLGLSNYRDKDASFHRLSNELWKDIDGKNSTENRLGKGYVFWGRSLVTILQSLKIKPDFSLSSQSGDAPVNYIHRRIGDADLYFIANYRRSTEDIVCTFRIKNRKPELWNAIDGSVTPLFVYEVMEDGIKVPLSLGPYGSVFIVFRARVDRDPLKSIQKNNSEILGTKPFDAITPNWNKEFGNNFTIAFWAKPESNIMLAPSVHMEQVKHPYTDYFAVYPYLDKNLYKEGTASCGLAVGRNGVAVWENSSGEPKMFLAVPVPLSGWNFIACQYEKGIPAIYIAGRLLKKGVASPNIVYPYLGPHVHNEDISYYNGDMTKPVLHKGVLSSQRIKKLGSKAISKNIGGPEIEQSTFDNRQALKIWKAGSYKLLYRSNKINEISVAAIPKPLEVTGNWHVFFPEGSGAPKQIVLNRLQSLHLHRDEGVKYFSGTATYKKTFFVAENMLASDKQQFLNLGSVEVIAHVMLNGSDLGTLWCRPYKTDITKVIKSGENILEIRVTNLWPNRLIGDEQMPDQNDFSPVSAAGSFETLVGGGINKVPDWYSKRLPKPADDRVTFTTWKHYTKASPLLSSGLIGPVVLETVVLVLLDEIK